MEDTAVMVDMDMDMDMDMVDMVAGDMEDMEDGDGENKVGIVLFGYTGCPF